ALIVLHHYQIPAQATRMFVLRSPHPVPNTTHATPGYLPVAKNCPGWVNKAQTYGSLAQVFGSDEGRLTL
ncbi:MAG: hypothetical protein AAFV96_10880, partial [Pseudomonadota bacterium]